MEMKTKKLPCKVIHINELNGVLSKHIHIHIKHHGLITIYAYKDRVVIDKHDAHINVVIE